MPRVTFSGFLGGMNLQDDEAVMDLKYSPNPQDVRFNRGLCETRPGYAVRGAEPSYLSSGTAKTARQELTFAAASSESGTATFTQTRKATQWVLYEGVPSDTSDGAYTLMAVTDGVNLIWRLDYVVSSGTVAYRVRCRDSAGNTMTGTTAYQTTAAWGATRRYIAFQPSNSSIYIGGVSTPLTITGALVTDFATPAQFHLSFDGTTQYASQAVTQVVITNEDLSLASSSLTQFYEQVPMRGTYFPMAYPVDSLDPDPDILLHYTFTENTGTTVYDWSRYSGQDLALANTPTWVTSPGGQMLSGRGLGMGVWQDKSGNFWNMTGFSRNGCRAATSVKQGVVYTDKIEKAWGTGTLGSGATSAEYFFGGIAAPDDTTAALQGLDSFARMQFIQSGFSCVMLNGVDHIRRIAVNTWRYMGGTAPPTAPILTVAGGGGNYWKFCYTYYNSVDGVETGRSPVALASDAATTDSLNWFISSDSQFDKVRIYRTTTNSTVFYLETTVAMGTGGPYTTWKTDAQLANAPLLPGDGTQEGNRAAKRLYQAFPDYRPEDNGEGADKGPPTAPTLGVTAGAGSLSAGTYYVAYAYKNSTTGELTGFSPVATQTGVIANDRINVSAMVLPGNTNYNQIVVYRTKASSFQWYEDQTITAAATASITQADSALSTTVETNALPPICHTGCVFGNRLWMADETGMLYWSAGGDHGSFPYQNGYKPRGGLPIRSIISGDTMMLVAWEDGVVYAMPLPGTETDLTLFVLVNLQPFADAGGCVAPDTVRETPYGMMWLSHDGVYRFSGGAIECISNRVAPYFSWANLNRVRWATAVWKGDESLYMVCLPRGYSKKSRLNDSWIVYYAKGDAWSHDNLPPCDVAGVLLDAGGADRYMFVMPTGILCELGTNQPMQQQAQTDERSIGVDGCGYAVAENLASSTSCSCTAPFYTSPVFDGGFAFTVQRNEAVSTSLNHSNQTWVLRNGTPFLSGLNFWPMITALVGATYKGYIGGIRSQWVTARFKVTPDEPSRYNAIENTYLHRTLARLQSNGGKIRAILGVQYPTAIDIAAIPAIQTQASAGVKHPVTLADTTTTGDYRLDEQHGDWGGAAQALGFTSVARSHIFMFINDPPEMGYGFAVTGLSIDYTPGDQQ